MYNILESRILRKDNRPHTVIVLVEISDGDVRAIRSNAKQSAAGYYTIDADKPITEEVLQEVAGFGFEIQDGEYWFGEWEGRHGKR